MFIDIVPNRGSPPAVLLRESYRDENGRTQKRTLANTIRSAIPPDVAGLQVEEGFAKIAGIQSFTHRMTSLVGHTVAGRADRFRVCR